jgi:hypothetical protein
MEKRGFGGCLSPLSSRVVGVRGLDPSRKKFGLIFYSFLRLFFGGFLAHGFCRWFSNFG